MNITTIKVQNPLKATNGKLFLKKFSNKSNALSYEYKLKKNRKRRSLILEKFITHEKKLKIATILPYKENYTFSKAQAAAIWVCDFLKFSKHKKENYIFGNTDTKDFLSKKYTNVPIKTKSRFSSTTIEYCNNFISLIKNKEFDIIEIHNRPLVFTYLKNKLDKKFILYFHNDPISMKGSKTISERLDLLNNVDKIIFVSKWTQKRFFKDIDQKLLHKTEVVYPSIHKIKRLLRKKKISFLSVN